MNCVSIDFSKKLGKIKPMHAVNNGPVYKFHADQRVTNMEAFKEAGIPYMRNHDASFNAIYGGEHTVDVNFIFPDFDADENDEKSYDFIVTDEYLRVIELTGGKVFYRLGSKIEHGVKKYGTLPPKDFHKWARICEHIIRHYTEGWADGFNMDIKYWEIWNEPDGQPDDSKNKATWGGNKKQFFEFYDVVARHLKECFPHLMIGGPALSTTAFDDYSWLEDFLIQLQAPLDFLSWHAYTTEPSHIAEQTRIVREILDRHGYEETESILNEWNYVKGWYDEDWLYSLRTEKNLKGAAFIASTMLACQNENLDMLMYYDARPCAMNGMFNTDFVCDCLKGYYPFKMFNSLYKLKNQVEVRSEDCNIYAVASTNDEKFSAMLSYYSDDNSMPDKNIDILFENVENNNGVEVVVSKLDDNRDNEAVSKQIFYSDNFKINLKFELYSSYLVEINKLKNA